MEARLFLVRAIIMANVCLSILEFFSVELYIFYCKMFSPWNKYRISSCIIKPIMSEMTCEEDEHNRWVIKDYG